MADIAPFRAIRFNPAKVNLSQVICPPYDVISVLDYDRLARRSPSNIVRIELPMKLGVGNRYANAASLLEKWQSRRILVRDSEPAFYGYEQRFHIATKAVYRRGFFAALRLEKPGRGHVRPHEMTFPKHKEDRLKLMRATQANISPIFMISMAGRKNIPSLLADRMKAKPLMVARDNGGVTHRVWRWTDPALQRTLIKALRGEDVLIADGHHRYETAWNYAQEKGRRSPGYSEAGYRYALVFLCPMDDPGLVIQPTHRSVRLDDGPVDWFKRVRPYYAMHPSGNIPELVSRLRSAKNPCVMVMAISGRGMFWLNPKSGQRPIMPVVRLHHHLLEGIPGDNISYNQNPYELVESVRRGESAAAFLLPPPDKEMFARLCRAGRLLPHKSTYFYPKLGTGLVLRTLRGAL